MYFLRSYIVCAQLSVLVETDIYLIGKYGVLAAVIAVDHFEVRKLQSVLAVYDACKKRSEVIVAYKRSLAALALEVAFMSESGRITHALFLMAHRALHKDIAAFGTGRLYLCRFVLVDTAYAAARADSVYHVMLVCRGQACFRADYAPLGSAASGLFYVPNVTRLFDDYGVGLVATQALEVDFSVRITSRLNVQYLGIVVTERVRHAVDRIEAAIFAGARAESALLTGRFLYYV